MTHIEYHQFQQAVEQFEIKNDVKPGCHSGLMLGVFFSNSPCRCCQRPLAGNRQEYEFATNDGKTFRADICVDCEYYLTYGRLDDTTMLEVETSLSYDCARARLDTAKIHLDATEQRLEQLTRLSWNDTARGERSTLLREATQHAIRELHAMLDMLGIRQ
jgi:hypothetical protein